MLRAIDRFVSVGAVVLLALAALPIPASSGSMPGMSLALPTALNAADESRVRFIVVSPVEQVAAVRFTVSSLDGQVAVPVYDGVLALRRGATEGAISIPPQDLTPFALGETVRLDGQVGPWKAEADLQVAAVVPEAGGWVLNVPATAVLYSTQDSQLNFRIVNPKGKPLSAKLQLKFKNLKGDVVAKWRYPVIALPGDSLYTVTVPVSVCLKAKLKGASSLKTFLKKDGVEKAAGQSLLDWDLVVSASADKTSAPAPLAVAFTALVSGGAAPYAYVWNFGDGTANSTAQNPAHTFTAPGLYTVSLVVVDNRGGTVAASPITIAAQ